VTVLRMKPIVAWFSEYKLPWSHKSTPLFNCVDRLNMSENTFRRVAPGTGINLMHEEFSVTALIH
jgi:hypothetical protein